MLWITWRQQRLTIVSLVAVFLGLVGHYLVSGAAMRGSLAPEVLPECLMSFGGECGEWTGVIWVNQSLRDSVLPLLPALVGMFLGAPLIARELEQRTVRYAWTQGVSRRHWLSTKLVLTGGVVVLSATAFSLAYRWWFTPRAADRGWFDIFSQGPLVFPASCLLSFALGVVFGTLTKRLVMSIALTMVGCFAIFVPTAFWLRPHYLSPLRGTMDTWPTGSLIVDSVYVGPSGAQTDLWGALSQIGYTSTSSFGSGQLEALKQAGFTKIIEYQPADRFWTFQVIEAGGYLALTAIALALTGVLLRRRSI